MHRRHFRQVGEVGGCNELEHVLERSLPAACVGARLGEATTHHGGGKQVLFEEHLEVDVRRQRPGTDRDDARTFIAQGGQLIALENRGAKKRDEDVVFPRFADDIVELPGGHTGKAQGILLQPAEGSDRLSGFPELTEKALQLHCRGRYIAGLGITRQDNETSARREQFQGFVSQDLPQPFVGTTVEWRRMRVEDPVKHAPGSQGRGQREAIDEPAVGYAFTGAVWGSEHHSLVCCAVLSNPLPAPSLLHARNLHQNTLRHH